MKQTSCLQYCLNGMNDRIFSFAQSKDGKALIDAFRKLLFVPESQIKELLIAYNSYFMVQAAIQIRGMPKTEKSVIKFMHSKDFTRLHKTLCDTVVDNYPKLMARLSQEQRQRLHESPPLL